MSDYLLSIKDLSVDYGEVKALDKVSLHIDEGEMVAVMGPNGAGKSTVLKAIFGLASVSGGSIYWHDKKVEPIPHEMVERSISFVPQGRRVFSSLSVRENLEIGAFFVKNKKEIKRRMEEVIDFFPDLKRKINDKSNTLSGGQQQMLAIARGLMSDPKLLMLDEPTLGLSPKIVKEVFSKIKEINERHKIAVIIVEHNLKSSLDIVDRAYVLDKGRQVFDGKPDKILESDFLEKVFLGKI